VLRTAGFLSSVVRVAYGSYAWIALVAIVSPLCLLLACAPRLEQRRRIARGAAKLFFAAIGSSVRLEGAANAMRPPCVVVANHASYLDGMILTAALPASFTYLVKHEMTRIPVAGFILRRLGTAFVNRHDFFDRKRIARRLVELARNGDALAFFPEGTFDAAPGLKPFQLGAFGAAARAKLPVVPVVICGSRRKLPSGAFLPLPGGALRVRICDPVHTAQHATPRRAMLATRQAMLAYLDEPDLAGTSGADLDFESTSNPDFQVPT
jgi:1-acyl-sn-glycerol-3-phosphate acyltransferase